MTNDDGEWLRIEKEQAVAFGRPEPVPPSFRVRKGSTAMREGSPIVKGDRAERDRLVEQGILVHDEDPALFRFTVDHVFSSRSRAAGIIIDGSSNGDSWKKVDPDTPNGTFTRAEIEGAMDAFDRYRETRENDEIFGRFGEPRDYWVRSSRERKNGIYPSKPIVAFILKRTELNGGWGQKGDAASRLHNSGFIIVDSNNKPIAPPEGLDHFVRQADRIRLCALNYYIAPARERGEVEVSVAARDLATLMAVSDIFPNICGALEGKLFQQMAQVPPPIHTEPNPSSTTAFTYTLTPQSGDPTVSDAIEHQELSATNLILYGPPGTGKTYQTAWEAVRLCLGDHGAANFQGSENRDALMSEYRRLANEGRIEFVTFHQSMSYEEFVEGLRPNTSDDAGEGPEEVDEGSGFRLTPCDGVFKRVSERARLDQGEARVSGRLDRSARVFKVALGRRVIDENMIRYGLDNNLIHVGWGGDIDWSNERFDDYDEIVTEWEAKKNKEVSGHDGNIVITFSFRADMQVGDYVVVSDGRDRFRAFGRVTSEYAYVEDAEFHPHRRRVEWLWRSDAGTERERFYPKSFRRHSVYKLNQQLVDWDALDAIVFGVDTPRAVPTARDHVLIIDEINRANISKVFGELITLLESDKRLGAQNEIRLVLPYSKRLFGVPANLHIIGTMNTADRSIALLDTALRRRFTFRELMPDPLVLSTNVDGINLQKLLTTINDRIEYLFDREHQIGHAYFTGCKTRPEIEAVMRHKVIPLLAEYFFEDWSKVAAVLGDTGQGGGKFLQSDRLPAPAGFENSGYETEKFRWRVKGQFVFSEFEA